MANNASVAQVVPGTPLAARRNRRWLLRHGAAAGAALPFLGPLSAAGARQTPAAETDYFGFAIEAAAQDGGTAIVQLPGETSSLFPLTYDGYFSGSTWGYGGLVWESLATLHPETGEYVPLLASGWEVSEDGLTWTFQLRQDAVWHDGTPFTSADVVYSYETAMSAEVNSFWRTLLVAEIAAISAPDAYTVVMTGTGVNAEFLEVGLIFLAPAHIWSGVAPADIVSHPGATGEDPAQVLGTGPFRFVERVPEDHTTVARYEAFRRGRPNIETIIFQYLPDSAAAEPLLRTGEVDYSWVTFQGADQFRELDGLTLYEYYSLDLVQFVPNHDPARTPFFGDKLVRQAMIYAVDREAVASAGYFGFASAAETILLPGMWSHDPEGITVSYAFDPERAAQLLDEAGWVMGDDGVRAKDGQRFAFTILGQEWWDQPELLVQENWRNVGIEMVIENVSWETLDEGVVGKDFDMTIIYFNCRGSGYDGISEVHSGEIDGGGNYAGISNARIDELADQLQVTIDPAERIPLFTEFQNVYLEEALAIPLVHDFDLRVKSDRFHNLYPNTYNAVFNAETWWLES